MVPECKDEGAIGIPGACSTSPVSASSTRVPEEDVLVDMRLSSTPTRESVQ
jgi:hypothetical protein